MSEVETIETVDETVQPEPIEQPEQVQQDDPLHVQRQREGRHLLLMQLAGVVQIDQRRQCRARIQAAYDQIESAITDSETGKRKAMLEGRYFETQRRLDAMRQQHDAAELRHCAALAAADEGELADARKAVLASGAEMEITKDELTVLNRLLYEATTAIDTSRKTMSRDIQARLHSQSFQALNKLVDELWALIASPDVISRLEQMVLETGVYGVSSGGPHRFDMNIDQFLTSGTVTV